MLYSPQSVSECTVYALQQEQELYFIEPRVSVHVLCMPYNNNNIQPRVSVHVLCMPYNNNINYTLFNPAGS